MQVYILKQARLHTGKRLCTGKRPAYMVFKNLLKSRTMTACPTVNSSGVTECHKVGVSSSGPHIPPQKH